MSIRRRLGSKLLRMRRLCVDSFFLIAYLSWFVFRSCVRASHRIASMDMHAHLHIVEYENYGVISVLVYGSDGWRFGCCCLISCFLGDI